MMTGSVRVRVTRVGASNAVVSGVFIGHGLSGNQPPTVSITSPSAGTMFTLGDVIPLAATAGDPDGAGRERRVLCRRPAPGHRHNRAVCLQLDERAGGPAHGNGRRDR